jgi:hypothetical protein
VLFETGEPYSRQDLLAALRRLDDAGEAYLVAMPGAEFFEPQGEAWSPSEHLRHLSKSARPVARALGMPRLVLAFRFGLNRGTSLTFADLRARYLDRLAAGVDAGRFAPSERPRPADPGRGRDEVLAEWHAANRALETAVLSWRERALDRYRLPHPALGLLTLREMLAFTVYHTAHHLGRVVERRATGVPADGD